MEEACISGLMGLNTKASGKRIELKGRGLIFGRIKGNI